MKTFFKNGSISGCGNMKRSESELAFLTFYGLQDDKKIHHQDEILGGSEPCDGILSSENGDHSPFIFSDICKGLSGINSLEDINPIWSVNFYSNHNNVSAPIDSQSSICVGSPMSVNNAKGNNQAVGASSGSSDEDDPEIEAGPCEQSTNPADMKRMKRMVSNRESARRSRRRKQAHLSELETQVETLRVENDTLFKRLSEASQQFKDSTTNNRVLKSNVEALRAQVKLAEDKVARGSWASSLSHLLQNHLNTSHNCMNNNMNHIDHNVPPMPVPRADDNSPYTMLSESTLTVENAETFNSNISNGVTPDGVPDIWN